MPRYSESILIWVDCVELVEESKENDEGRNS